MLNELTVNFSNLLLSLSDAVDLANSKIASHQMRTAFIVWQLCRTAQLPEVETDQLYMAALLHDIGALSLEEKQRLHDFIEVDLDTHCILSEALFNLSPLLSPAARVVRFHHKPWREWDDPLSSPDVFGAQILYLADLLERFIVRDQYILLQVDDLKKKILAVSGNELHPEIVDLFMQIAHREDFWFDLTSPRLYSLLLHSGPYRLTEIGSSSIFSIASLFRHIIDFKSRFTASHSTGVAECAVLLSQKFGLTDTEIVQMEIAGYFHDLGKLAVPNAILEKNSGLTKEEFAIIRQHTYFTYSVLNTVGGLDQISEWAAFHHERLDGSGYPFHISADKINIGARIMAVADLFTAVAEDRPYRKGMERKQIESILLSQVNKNANDKRITMLLLDNYQEIVARVKEKQALSTEMFEKKFQQCTQKSS
ncbi:MAG TPA: HD domain-containing protein [Desulfobulbus sp.]|nr:HD domain-containing protein [Desulfobulbus sp.]